MAYTRSIPLSDWFGRRRDTIDTLEAAHKAAAGTGGPGRPSAAAQPLAHAYTLGVVAEFQGFVRALHDLAVERWMLVAVGEDRLRPQVEGAVLASRALDRGNADLGSVSNDFGRIGLRGLAGLLQPSAPNRGPARSDVAQYQDLISLRNALAHGNEQQLAALRRKSPAILDTLGWTRSRLPSLNRTARLLDKLVWDHLSATLQTEPW